MLRQTTSATKGPRIEREKRTVSAMIELYCADRHTAPHGELCPACAELRAYAMQRLDRCPFQEEKTTCANCAVHCYRPDRKEQIRVVMRYAGPRMLLRHPVLALLHVADGRRPAPPKPRGAKATGPSVPVAQVPSSTAPAQKQAVASAAPVSGTRNQ